MASVIYKPKLPMKAVPIMKKLFYYTDVLPLLGKGELAIGKLQRNLEIFRNASDQIHLVWHPYLDTVKYLELNASPFLEPYQHILKTFQEEGWGELDESRDPTTVLRECNAYYGDVCDLIYEAQNLHLPVMIQNIEL